MQRFSSRVLATWLLLIAAGLAGCAGAPMQEMSNARQAVKAAEQAGASKTAPELLAEANLLLKTAREHLYEGNYRDARDEAELARTKAVEARRVAEQAGPRPNP